MRYFATSHSPFKSRRNILSPHAGWPTQELVSSPVAPATPRYSDEEQFALQAWSNAWLRTAPLVQQVDVLCHYPGLEPVYLRQVQRALASKCPQALAEIAEMLWRLTNERHEHRLNINHKFSLISSSMLP